MGSGAMAPKAKKKDKEDNDVLTRIAIVSSDRYVVLAITAWWSSCGDQAFAALIPCYMLAVHDA